MRQKDTFNVTGTPPKKCRKKFPRYPGGKLMAALYFLLLYTKPVHAADIWAKANLLMRDIYSQILGISTIAAVVTASIALLLMNFSRSGRTVDESRAWLKRIILCWAILNSLGFILAYITPFFQGGQWIPGT
ncbi:MAG: fimbrial protein [Lachnospiraceae bacterium]|nr:fimbrial protein [Lachnospiraceae bacterium]